MDLQRINFFSRLKAFIENAQVSDMISEEEKQMILYVCDNYQPNSPAIKTADDLRKQFFIDRRFSWSDKNLAYIYYLEEMILQLKFKPGEPISNDAEEILKHLIDANDFGYKYDNIISTQSAMHEMIKIALHAMKLYRKAAVKDTVKIKMEVPPMTEELLIKIFKKVSLQDLSGAEFSYARHGDIWHRSEAYKKDKIVDAIKYEGNNFYMLNNDGSYSLLNPMIDAFKIMFNLV